MSESEKKNTENENNRTRSQLTASGHCNKILKSACVIVVVVVVFFYSLSHFNFWVPFHFTLSQKPTRETVFFFVVQPKTEEKKKPSTRDKKTPFFWLKYIKL